MKNRNNCIQKLTAFCAALVMMIMLPIQAFAAETDTARYNSHLIEVESILQLPELPTGCETVSLTMLLNYLGYPADKLDLARNYLPKQEFYYVDEQLYGADFVTTFAGDPEDDASYGCYAPCVVVTANRYLRANAYKGTAYDLTGTDFELLLRGYIDHDIPLVIWITNYELEPSNLSTIWKTPEGKTVQWRRPEHCVVLTGYDRERELIYVSDPIYGNRSYDYDTLVERFGEMGKQAVYIDASPDKLPEKSDTADTPDNAPAFGDVNSDGAVDSADALLILRSSVGLATFDDEQSTLGDVNGDGKVDSADALSVLRYSVNLYDKTTRLS